MAPENAADAAAARGFKGAVASGASGMAPSVTAACSASDGRRSGRDTVGGFGGIAASATEAYGAAARGEALRWSAGQTPGTVPTFSTRQGSAGSPVCGT